MLSALLVTLASLQQRNVGMHALDISERQALIANIQRLCSRSDRATEDSARLVERHFDDAKRPPRASAAVWRSAGCRAARGFAATLLFPVNARSTIKPADRDAAHLAMQVTRRGLSLYPGDHALAVLLASLSLQSAHDPAALRGEPLALMAFQMLRAIDAGVHDTTVARACVAILRVFQEPGEAHLCAHLALSAGVDSAWQLLNLAAIELSRGDSGLGLTALRRGIAVSINGDTGAHRMLQRVPGGLLSIMESPPREGNDTPRLLEDFVQRTMLTRDSIQPEFYCKVGAELLKYCVRPDSVDRRMQLAVQLHRIWDPQTGQLFAVVCLAVDARRDSGVTVPADSVLQVMLTLWDSNASAVGVSHISRNIGAFRGQHDLHFATYALFGWPADAREWNLLASQNDGRHGAQFGALPPLANGALAISDPIVGTDQQHLTVMIGRRAVWRSPILEFRGDHAIRVYYQINATRANSGLHTSLAVTVPSDPSAVLLSETFRDTAVIGINERSQDIDVSHLPAGSYALRLRSADGSGNTATSWSVRILLK